MIEASGTSNLCYDDILLVPGLSNVKSRSNVTLESKLGNPNNPEGIITLFNPLIIAPMEFISSPKMLVEIEEKGGVGFVHRFQSIEDRLSQIKLLNTGRVRDRIGISISILEIEKPLIDQFLSNGAKIILLDTAFSHTEVTVEAVKRLRSMVPNNIHIMTGNSSSAESYVQLMNAGADSVRIGIGGGAACTTRVVTGFGVPVLGSIMDVYEAVKNDDVNGIVADGGIKQNGDIVKALAAGASAVMMGSMFAGYDECDGDVDGRKQFRGLASEAIQIKNKEDKLNPISTHIEGVSGYVESKGPASIGIQYMINNIKSGFSYTGATNIKEFQNTVKYIKVSPLSVVESGSRI